MRGLLSRRASAPVFVLWALLASAPASGQTPPPPMPAAGGPPNVFFGALPPSPPYPDHSDVIVFLHGLNTNASSWWVDNDMYELAYRAGYRTAFISMSADNASNASTFLENGGTFASLLPFILDHYGVSKVVIVGHSKGGLDAQAGIVGYPEVADATKALFTISTPNTGSELADWLFTTPEGQSLGTTFGLLTAGVESLRPSTVGAFRDRADPVLTSLGIPIYTISADFYPNNPITIVTGNILKNLVPEEKNDGFVTEQRARLSENIASDLGRVFTDHFHSDSGTHSFPKIAGRLQALEFTLNEFKRIESDGFGDRHNTWAWSMEWFQGKLYVGTGREAQCVSLKTSDQQIGTNIYGLAAGGGDCPSDEALLGSLQAEIWQFTPETSRWKRVFQSPLVSLGDDGAGNPILTARDIGFRGMTTFVEPDGREVLYVGGVTSGSIYDKLTPSLEQGYAPPRLLRSLDGETWQAVPAAPGTLLGEIGNPLPGSTRKLRSFRALTPYKGKLFATVGDIRGVGVVLVSSEPWLGNDAWKVASPIAEQFPVWNLAVAYGHLYATTGDRDYSKDGFGLYRTDASGEPPYVWSPVIENGAFQLNPYQRAPNGLSFANFGGHLYLGTNRPTEMYRINADDTWDLIAGEPRMTPDGYKTPLSGLGIGFGSWFNGHFWRMAAHAGRLYLSTWDWSLGLTLLNPIDSLFASNHGFDLLRTDDAIHWYSVTRGGFGDGLNTGGRSLESTPVGLFVGTARSAGGAQVFQCLEPDCTGPPTTPVAPSLLHSVSEQLAGRQVVLSWQPSPGAVRYRVYRATVMPLSSLIPKGVPITIRSLGLTVTIEDIRNGALDFFCIETGSDFVCDLIRAIKAESDIALGLPGPFVQVGMTDTPSYEEAAPTEYQSIYFVRAEDGSGALSPPSNFVGAPSKADQTPPTLTAPPDVIVTVEGADRATVALGAALAEDNSGGPVRVTNDAPANAVFPLGTTVVTWTATDGSRNSAMATQRVTVILAGPDADGLPDEWEELFGLKTTSGGGDDGPSGDPDHDGRSNLDEYRAGTHPRGQVTQYVAEGATGPLFDLKLALANPSATDSAIVLLRFEAAGGTTISHRVVIPPLARRSVNPETLPGLENAAMATVIESDVEVVVNRTMQWNPGSHAQSAVPQPSKSWYLAEGATHSGLQMFYLIQNPTTETAQVDIEYLPPAPRTPVVRHYTVPPGRFNVWVNREPGLANAEVGATITSDVEVIVERAMYLNGTGPGFLAGHESAGVTAPATEWFLAEGATGDYFDFFLLIANPNSTTSELLAQYLLPDGSVIERRYAVAAKSRLTVWVNAEGGRLADTAVSTVITATNGVPVVVERGMWWPGPTASTWAEAHNAPGTSLPGERWALAEGECAPGVDTYVLVANTSPYPGTLNVTLLFEDGAAPATQTFTLAAMSRFNLVPAAHFPTACPAGGSRRFGMLLESVAGDGPGPAQIVVEQSIYGGVNGRGWTSGSSVQGTRLR